MSYKIETSNIHQNNQGFLLGIFKMCELRKFVKFTELIVLDFDENNMPIYNKEVQRKIKPSKVDGIADFLIHDTDSFFPTNIVVSIPEIALEEIEQIDEQHTNIYLKDFVLKENLKENGQIYITIIDGQHRIAGIEKAIKRIEEANNILEHQIRSVKENEKYAKDLEKNVELLKRLYDFEIIISFFVDPTLEYQAMIFSTINRTQTKVSEDLVYSLFGLSKNDSPQKTSLEVVLALNAVESSPFYNRIKLAGAKYSKNSIPPLSQATMVKSILYLISPNLKQAEIEKNKDRSYVLQKHFDVFLPFRRYYGKKEDHKIILIINSFFKAVLETFKSENGISYWGINSTENILQTTVGYRALIMILTELLKLASEEEKFDLSYYLKKLKLAENIDFEDNNEPKRFPLTSKTVNILYNELGGKILGKNFVPKEIKD